MTGRADRRRPTAADFTPTHHGGEHCHRRIVTVLQSLPTPRPGSGSPILPGLPTQSRAATGLARGHHYEALAHEFALRDIPFTSQVPCLVEYKEQRLHGVYRLDFVCFDSVVVEVKASAAPTPADYAQVLNYLTVSCREAMNRRSICGCHFFGSTSAWYTSLRDSGLTCGEPPAGELPARFCIMPTAIRSLAGSIQNHVPNAPPQ